MLQYQQIQQEIVSHVDYNNGVVNEIYIHVNLQILL